jgi:hypothetical protein
MLCVSVVKDDSLDVINICVLMSDSSIEDSKAEELINKTIYTQYFFLSLAEQSLRVLMQLLNNWTVVEFRI